MNDQRPAWEDHTLDVEQLDLFSVEPEPEPERGRGAYDEPDAERVYQLTELPGSSFEDIFEGAA